MKSILVTGGAGFIGSNFILQQMHIRNDLRIINLDKLTYAGNLSNLRSLDHNPDYRFVRGDICDADLLDTLFQEESVTAVVNFAAESHVDRSIADPEIFVRTNVLGTLSLLNAARKAWQTGESRYRDGVKFLQVSTDEVYGSLGADGFFTEQTPLDPHSPYSASKASADLLVRAWSDTYRLPVNITRCSNNYGPYQFPEKLIPLMINNALHLNSLPVYGDGLQIRDWLYVDDHCHALMKVLENGIPGEVYNIGGHNERTNLHVVGEVLRYLNAHVDSNINESLIQHIEDRKGHDRRYGIDPSKISNELGWRPETSFEEGIQRTIRWYLDNRSWMEEVTSGAYQKYYQNMYKDKSL